MGQSSKDTEFKSMVLEIYELLWPKIILVDFQIKWKGPIKVYCDNKPTFNISHNHVQHDKTKYVEVNRHFIGKLDSGLIST